MKTLLVPPLLLILVASVDAFSTRGSIRTTAINSVTGFASAPTVGRQVFHLKKPTKSILYAATIDTTTEEDNKITTNDNKKKNVFIRMIRSFLQIIQRVLYPSVQADESFPDVPMPSGGLGCPLFGKITPKVGSTDYGAGSWFMKQQQSRAKNKIFSGSSSSSRVLKYMLFNRPIATIGGGANVQSIMNQEFDPKGIISAIPTPEEGEEDSEPTFFAGTSLIVEKSRQRHALTRRLIGQAMTPQAVSKSLPNLQASAEVCIDKLITTSNNNHQQQEGGVKIEDICTDYTLDVSWRQILGLNLHSQKEIDEFAQMVKTWINGMSSIRGLFRIGIETHPGFKAKEWLEAKIEEKVQQLEDGTDASDDASTLRGMVFATEEDEEQDSGGMKRRLSPQQIIGNSMLLMLAGSETSATTLTNAVLGMGLNKETWNKLVQEQRTVQEKFGDQITKEALENSPYLDGVVKESLRMKPVAGGIPRVAQETLIVEGKQIPKGWIVECSSTMTHYLDPKTYQEDGSHMDMDRGGWNPDRWLDESTAPSTDFIPFGAGPRYCLGVNLANAEMRMFLAVLARKIENFDLVMDNNKKRKPKLRWRRLSIIPKLLNGVPITVQAR